MKAASRPASRGRVWEVEVEAGVEEEGEEEGEEEEVQVGVEGEVNVDKYFSLRQAVFPAEN